MTPFGRWVRNGLERLLGRFEEGQDAPPRIREQVLAFANHFPKATREQWVAFAAGFAEECYSSGYVRGVEWAEREPRPTGATPEQIADLIDPTWIDRPWRPDLELEAPADVVPERRDPQDVLRDQVAALRPKARRF